jgi:hypothetical protein
MGGKQGIGGMFGKHGASKGVDLDVVGKINGVSVYEFDVDSVDDKPWRRPGNYKH